MLSFFPCPHIQKESEWGTVGIPPKWQLLRGAPGIGKRGLSGSAWISLRRFAGVELGQTFK